MDDRRPGARELPSGIVTFLFTDVEGSTRILREIGDDAFARLLREHHGILRQALARHGGVEVSTQGDAFFVAFSDAAQALACALDAQKELATTPLRVRMGIHTCEAVLGGDDYTGLEVHRASRISAAAHGGQIVLSAATADAVPPAPIRDLGVHRLKDLEAPIRLYQLGDGDFPPLRSLPTTNLPVPATPFVGRDAELAEIVGLVRAPGVRLLTLTGPGGTGKTRLALQAAGQASDDYPDGVLWVSLSSLRDPSLVAPTVAEVVGAREEGEQALADGIARSLADKHILLFLDSAEHVLSGVAEVVGAVLESSSGVLVLATSRSPLGLRGEHVYSVPPMTSEEAVTLFVSRARAADRMFELTDGNRRSVEELCERLDNLPLGIELAAARVAALPPAVLLEHLSRRLDLLRGPREAEARHSTLTATIAWSYDLLRDEEKALFARLSVFAAGCTLEGAEAVCDAQLEDVVSLVDQSLLRQREDRDGTPRYWMLNLIREYATERLEETEEVEAIRRRHAEWLLGLAEDVPESAAGKQVHLARLATEHDDLRAAVAYAVERRDAMLASRFVKALRRFWWVRGHFAEGQEFSEAALALEPDDEAARAWTLVVAGGFARRRGDVEIARRRHEEAVAIFERIGDVEGSGIALDHLGQDLSLASPSSDEAVGFHERAVAALRSVSSLTLPIALVNLGTELMRLGRFPEAEEALGEARARFEARGDPYGPAITTGTLAGSALLQGDLDRAAQLYARALSDVARLEDDTSAASFLDELAIVSAGRRRPEATARMWGTARSVLDAAGVEADPLFASVRKAAEERVRAELGDETFEALLAEGASMPLGDAVELALDVLTGEELGRAGGGGRGT